MSFNKQTNNKQANLPLLTIKIEYYAVFREKRGCSQETLTVSCKTPRELYIKLQSCYNFQLAVELVKVAVNGAFVSWDILLSQGDTVVFIPPVAGG